MSNSLQGASLDQMVLGGAAIDEIGDFLDSLDHDGRLAQVHASSRRMQRSLWQAASRTAPLGLDDFVGHHVPDGQVVPIHGFNSLPIPSFGRKFQKPMFRPPGRSDELWGYNISPFGPLIGPGYFVHTPTQHEADWEGRGGTVIDYFKVPDGDVPDHWPSVRPNTRGLQMFVYAHTRDFMRRVSEHVTIGAAFKKDQPEEMGAFFILVREDR